MSLRKWLLLVLTPNTIRKSQIELDEEANSIEFKEDSIKEYRLLGAAQKPLSKREQFELLDLIKEWLKGLESKTEINLLANNAFRSIEGSEHILRLIEEHCALKAEEFNLKEESRQAFLGMKYDLYALKSISRLLYISVQPRQICLISGDSLRYERILVHPIGVQDITDGIQILRKNGQLSSLSLFVKSSIYRLIETAKFFGKPQFVSFDDHSSRLLSSSINSDFRSPKLETEVVNELVSKILASDFQHLTYIPWMSFESLDFISAHILTLAYILEGLGVHSLLLDNDFSLKGYVIDKMLSEGRSIEGCLDHQNDWKKSAQDILMRLYPNEFSRSAQLASLFSKLFDSSKGWLHDWAEKERRLGWLSAFFSSVFGQYNFETGCEMLAHVEAIGRGESQQVMTIIALASLPSLAGQSRFLELLPPQSRPLVRKLAALVQLTKALDVTGRAAVHNVKLEHNPDNPTRTVLSIVPRLNLAPELTQVDIVKRQFENQFERKLFVQQQG